VSLKAPLVVLWAIVIAGTTVASENHRLCDAKIHIDLHTDAKMQRLDGKLNSDDDQIEVLVIAEVSETN
jgi:hypothetical protein